MLISVDIKDVEKVSIINLRGSILLSDQKLFNPTYHYSTENRILYSIIMFLRLKAEIRRISTRKLRSKSAIFSALAENGFSYIFFGLRSSVHWLLLNLLKWFLCLYCCGFVSFQFSSAKNVVRYSWWKLNFSVHVISLSYSAPPRKDKLRTSTEKFNFSSLMTKCTISAGCCSERW